MKIQTLQWVVGIYCAVIGTLILIVPHQFNAPVYVLVQPVLMWWGTLFLLAGLALIAIGTLAPPRNVVIVVHMLAVPPLLLVAIGFAISTIWTGTINFLILALGILLAPLVAYREGGRSEVDSFVCPDLFAVLMGLSALSMGLIALLLPAQFMSPIYDIVRPRLPVHGAALIVSGVVLLVTQLRRTHSKFLHRAVPALVVAAFLPFLTLSLVNHMWTGVAFYGGFGLTLVLLPWLGPRIRRIDPVALQTRLALLLMALVALPLIAIVSIGMTSYERQAAHEALAREQGLATVVAQDVETYVHLHQAPVAGLAAHPDLMTMPVARQRALLEGFGHVYPDMVAVATYDAGGAAIARSDGRPPTAVKGFPIYEQARRTNRPSLDILISPVIHRPIFAFGSPVLDAGGHFIGLVSGVLEATRLAEVLVRSGRETNGSVYLVDQSGRAIAHPDDRLVSSFASLTALPPVAAFIHDPRGGTLRYGPSATEVFAASMPVPGFGWGVIVERPASDALAVVHRIREQSFGVLALLLLLCGLLSAWLARRLAAPLEMLTRAIVDFATGTETTALPQTTVSEVADLTAGFALMRQQILTRTREREQAEAQLRTQTRQLAKAQEIAHVGSWEWDIALNIVMASPELWRIYGRQPALASVPYEAFLQCVHPDDRDRVHAVIMDALQHHRPFQFEHRVIQPDGTLRDLLAMGEVEVDPAGRVLRMIGTGYDTTDQKRAAAARLAWHAAEQANRAKSEFLSRMSHELRTPLNAILGFAQVLEMDGLEPLAQESVDQILKGGRHLLTLVNEVLDITAVESGRLAISLEAVLLGDVVADVIALLAPVAAQHGVTLDARLEPEAGCYVLADEQRLTQVLLNLMANAIKYNRAGGSVVVSYGPAHEGRLRIQVCDTGPGIPAAQLARLFTPFERLDAGETMIEGTGLGLALSRRLIEAMCGTVGVDSVVGSGSTFWLELPYGERPGDLPGLACPQHRSDPLAPGATTLPVLSLA